MNDVTRNAFARSVDLLDLAEAISSTGASLVSIGRHITVMYEAPSREQIDQIAEYATRILVAANQLRQIK